MKDLGITVEEITLLMDKMARLEMSSLLLEKGDFRLQLEGRREAVPALQPAAPLPQAAPAPQAAPEEPKEEPGQVVTAPIVGTFYAAASPEKPPFVQVGDRVEKGQVLFIIESMKLMNEVSSQVEGTVSAILVENGQPVEYGQPVMRIVP